MNRTIALLILGVILLAMALIMVNQYMTQPEDRAAAPASATETPPATPQEASPQAVLSHLEQRAATSELASKGNGATTPAKQAMPAWASNAPGLTPPPPPTGKPTEAVGATAMTPPSVPAAQSSPPGADRSATTTASPSAPPAQAKVAPTQTRPEPTHVEPAKVDPPKPAPAKAKPKGPKTIKKISVIRMDDEVAVRLEGSEALTYKTMHLKSPDRLVVDLDDQWAIKAPGVPENKYVSNVRIGKQGDKTRIVIDLRQAPQSVRFIKRGAEGLDVRIK